MELLWLGKKKFRVWRENSHNATFSFRQLNHIHNMHAVQWGCCCFTNVTSYDTEIEDLFVFAVLQQFNLHLCCEFHCFKVFVLFCLVCVFCFVFSHSCHLATLEGRDHPSDYLIRLEPHWHLQAADRTALNTIRQDSLKLMVEALSSAGTWRSPRQPADVTQWNGPHKTARYTLQM